MCDLLLELLGGVLDGIIPERLHTMLITGIVAVAGVILAGFGAYAVYFAVLLAVRLAFGPAVGALLAALFFAGLCVFCYALTLDGIRTLRKPTRSRVS